MTLAFIFPGQGSQLVGMGKELVDAFPIAGEVFQEVDDALDENLSKIIFEGPEESLTLTENAQPALMAVSLAVMRVLRSEGGVELVSMAKYVSGHSLGEYSALAAVDTFTLSDAAKLLKIRGRAMQKAVPVGEGGMAAVLGLDMEIINKVVVEAGQGKICTAANDNANGQVVISGDKTAVERAAVIARDFGAKRVVILPVSAPFHCALMAPAAAVMEEALLSVRMSAPKIPVISNVTASEVSEASEIRRLLVEQITGMVRWREGVLYMRDKGVKQLVEIGSGKVLSGLTKRIDKSMASLSVGTPENVGAFLESVK